MPLESNHIEADRIALLVPGGTTTINAPLIERAAIAYRLRVVMSGHNPVITRLNVADMGG